MLLGKIVAWPLLPQAVMVFNDSLDEPREIWPWGVLIKQDAQNILFFQEFSFEMNLHLYNVKHQQLGSCPQVIFSIVPVVRL